MIDIGPNLFELLSTVVHTIGVVFVVFLIMNAYNKI
jgi:hypothetical protein